MPAYYPKSRARAKLGRWVMGKERVLVSIYPLPKPYRSLNVPCFFPTRSPAFTRTEAFTMAEMPLIVSSR